MSGKTMNFAGHFKELRSRVIWVSVIVVLFTSIGLFFAGKVIQYLKAVPPASGMVWNAFSPWDAIRIYMQVSVTIGLCLSMPFIIYHIWAFAKPGLHAKERKGIAFYYVAAIGLFLVGFAFAYFIAFPMVFHFMSVITSRIGITETYGAAQYLSFMFNIIIPLSVLFELPVIVMILTKFRILNPRKLYKMRRYAYFVLFIIAATITPPDVISDVIVTIPLFLLYECSVLLSYLVHRKQLSR